MKIKSLSIRDFKIIEELICAPKALTVLSGDNGVGKSAVLHAITDLFVGGHNPDVIRHGAKRAQIVIEFDNGQSFEKTIRPKSTEVVVKTNGEAQKEPQTIIKAIAKRAQFDPLEFTVKSPKEQLDQLVSIAGISITAGDLLAHWPDIKVTSISGTKLEPNGNKLTVDQVLAEFSAKPSEPMDLDSLQSLRARIYETRTKANAAYKEASATHQDMAKLVRLDGPGGENTDWEKEASDSQRLLNRAEAALTENLNNIDKDTTALCAKFDAILAAEIARVTAECEEAKQQARKDGNQLERECRERHASVISRRAEAATIARQNAMGAARAAGLKEQVANASARAHTLSKRAESLTVAIETIDAVRSGAVAAITERFGEDVTFRDGEIIVDGIPFRELNTQKQYVFAIEVAALDPGECNFMICDRAESIVGQQWNDLAEAILASGYQVFLAKSIAFEPLTVETADTMDQLNAKLPKRPAQSALVPESSGKYPD